MNGVKVKITYYFNGSGPRTIESLYEGGLDAGYIDEFIIQAVMSVEEPGTQSIYPGMVDIPWGAAPEKAQTFKQIAADLGISDLTYEIENEIRELRA